VADDDDGGGRWRDLARANARFGRRIAGAGDAAGAGYTLIGAIIVFGAIGYGLDSWLRRSPWFLVSGLLLGVFVGMWELAKTVFRR